MVKRAGALCALAVSACAAAPPVYGPGAVQPVVTNSGAAPAPANAERLYPVERLRLCRGLSVSNAPASDRRGLVAGYNRLIVVDGHTPLVLAPAENVCMTSGFGPRFGRPHQGIDLQARPASRVFSGGAGRVVEVRNASGYGLYVLIDHGRGVYTRYAHLARVEPAIQPGERVWFGRPIGLMGASGNATGIHLHYEILTGNYDNPRRSFGLTAHNPFSFPAYVAPPAAS